MRRRESRVGLALSSTLYRAIGGRSGWYRPEWLRYVALYWETVIRGNDLVTGVTTVSTWACESTEMRRMLVSGCIMIHSSGRPRSVDVLVLLLGRNYPSLSACST